MQLKSHSETALNDWIGPSTWDSDHSIDRQRFYKFTRRYQTDHGYTMNEADMRDVIKTKVRAKGHAFGPSQENLIHELVVLARNILEFLEATGR